MIRLIASAWTVRFCKTGPKYYPRKFLNLSRPEEERNSFYTRQVDGSTPISAGSLLCFRTRFPILPRMVPSVSTREGGLLRADRPRPCQWNYSGRKTSAGLFSFIFQSKEMLCGKGKWPSLWSHKKSCALWCGDGGGSDNARRSLSQSRHLQFWRCSSSFDYFRVNIKTGSNRNVP